MAFKFADVFKSTKDFFGRSFSDEHKVEVKTASDNGVVFTTEGGVTAKRGGFGSLKAEYKKGDFKVDKLQIGTDQRIQAEFSLDKIAPRTRATFKLEDGTRTSGANASAKIGFESIQDLGARTGLTAEVDAVNATANASALFNMQGVLLGVSGAVNTHLNDSDSKGVEPTAYDAVVGYQTPSSIFGVQTEKKFSRAVAFFHNAANRDFLMTGRASFGLNPAALKQVNVEFGGKYRWDASTTLFGAVNQNADLKLAYQQAVSPNATLSVFGEVKALDLASDSHKLGTKLSLKA